MSEVVLKLSGIVRTFKQGRADLHVGDDLLGVGQLVAAADDAARRNGQRAERERRPCRSPRTHQPQGAANRKPARPSRATSSGSSVSQRR